MKITLIAVPYHLDRENVGMGAGPTRFKEAGADRFLRDPGHEAEFHDVHLQGEHSGELEAIAEIDAQVEQEVREAIRSGNFPLVVGGNCNVCLGALAGLGGTNVGIVWLDAHGDSNTPEISQSGFFDGMALAVATGACHAEVARRVGLERCVPEANVVLAAVRDLDPLEKERLDAGEIAVVPYEPQATLTRIEQALDSLRERVDSVYLHVDLDVLNPDEARANEYSPPGGLSRRELGEAIEVVARRFVVRVASVTAYNPAYDPDGKVLEAGLEVIAQLASIAQRQRE